MKSSGFHLKSSGFQLKSLGFRLKSPISGLRVLLQVSWGFRANMKSTLVDFGHCMKAGLGLRDHGLAFRVHVMCSGYQGSTDIFN